MKQALTLVQSVEYIMVPTITSSSSDSDSDVMMVRLVKLDQEQPVVVKPVEAAKLNESAVITTTENMRFE